MKNNLTINDALCQLGINSKAARQLSVNDTFDYTSITEDIKNGLILEWLYFIDYYTDTLQNNYEDLVLEIFFNEMSDQVFVDISESELYKMYKDPNYKAVVRIIDSVIQHNKLGKYVIKLNLAEYEKLIKTK
jgi:hypothetical protein